MVGILFAYWCMAPVAAMEEATAGADDDGDDAILAAFSFGFDERQLAGCIMWALWSGVCLCWPRLRTFIWLAQSVDPGPDQALRALQERQMDVLSALARS